MTEEELLKIFDDHVEQWLEGISPDDIRHRAARAAIAVIANHWHDCFADGLPLADFMCDGGIIAEIIQNWTAQVEALASVKKAQDKRG